MRLSAKRRGESTVIAELRQQGSLKALFPHTAGPQLDSVFLNTAGGLTGGDRMKIDVVAGADTRVCVSSQAAERAYRAQCGDVATVQVVLSAESGAQLHWIPQETILFEGAAIRRELKIDLVADATALIVEPLVFGRAAMGEVVHNLYFEDQWRVRRDRRLVFADAVSIKGDAAAQLSRTAVADSAGAIATILMSGPAARGFSDIDLPSNCGVSLIEEDLLLIRLMATDSFALRKILIPLVETLSDNPVPRVWRL